MAMEQKDLKRLVTDSSLSTTDLWWVIMSGATKVTISVHIPRLEGTAFGQQLADTTSKYCQETRERFNRVRRGESAASVTMPTDPFDMVCLQYLSTLQQLVCRIPPGECTLQQLYRVPTYHLQLAATAGRVVLEGLDGSELSPNCHVAPLRLSAFEDAGMLGEFDRWPACSLRLVRDESKLEAIQSIQGKVRDVGGNTLYFKPREEGREGEFSRELTILSRADLTCSTGEDVRLSKLRGLVSASGAHGNEETIGLLLDWIPSTSEVGSLLNPGHWAMKDLFPRWKRQVNTTVHWLHSHSVCWGDVNPGNVMIDDQMDAWIIDFGGLNNAEFVDDDLAGTVEGDWQGVERLFDAWLPQRSAATRSQET